MHSCGLKLYLVGRFCVGGAGGVGGLFHESAIPLKRLMDFSEKNPESRIAQLLGEDYFRDTEGGWV